MNRDQIKALKLKAQQEAACPDSDAKSGRNHIEHAAKMRQRALKQKKKEEEVARGNEKARQAEEQKRQFLDALEDKTAESSADSLEALKQSVEQLDIKQKEAQQRAKNHALKLEEDVLQAERERVLNMSSDERDAYLRGLETKIHQTQSVIAEKQQSQKNMENSVEIRRHEPRKKEKATKPNNVLPSFLHEAEEADFDHENENYKSGTPADLLLIHKNTKALRKSGEIL